jgi:hypothetical protein
MQNASFLWGWNGYQPQPDFLMTRARLARLLRAWRRGERQPRNGGPLFKLERIRMLEGRAYRVTALRYHPVETATVVILSPRSAQE